MPISCKPFAVAATVLGFAGCAVAAEPVRTIGIYVEPFYRSAPTPDKRPQVAVGKQYNALLNSAKRDDIRAAREIAANPKLVTPITLMVLAIRFYDVGLRDDAVFWAIVMSGGARREDATARAGRRRRAQLRHVGRPVHQRLCLLRSRQVERAACRGGRVGGEHPYEVMFMVRAPAMPGDRAENAKHALANAKVRAAKERAYLDDAKNVEAFYATRKRNEADVKLCWK